MLTPLSSLAARVKDGLILCASMDEDRGDQREMEMYKKHAKKVFKDLSYDSPQRLTMDSGAFSFQYVANGPGHLTTSWWECDFVS